MTTNVKTFFNRKESKGITQRSQGIEILKSDFAYFASA